MKRKAITIKDSPGQGRSSMAGRLFLVPCSLANQSAEQALSSPSLKLISKISYFIVENAKSARAFLKSAGTDTPLQQLDIREFSEHTPESEISLLLEPVIQGRSAGLISEAGVPCLADPGSLLVAAAHKSSIMVVPLAGPSAVLMAIISSGLNGQKFAFSGYLPAKPEERSAAIRELERISAATRQSQFFIETPYRAAKLFSSILESCAASTRLSLAVNIGSETGWCFTATVSEWRRKPADIQDQLVVFGMQALPK